MSFKLPTSQEKANFVHNQFERIARRYNLTNDVISLGMHRFWKEKAISQLDLRADGTYLDVCCGTGDLALRIARQLGPNGRVVGIDFSSSMLDIAAQQARERAVEAAVEFVKGDAQNLPFPAHYFDGAVISFGLRNLTDLVQGIKEMARVVKPGGRVVNLDLGHPSLPLFTPLYQAYFSYIVPILGAILQSNRQAYTYLPQSLKTYPNSQEIANIFRSSGLKDIAFHQLALGSVALHVGTVE
ncbi:MAG: bifunctional demethylmenaquinone methyltransferase/2-methoxy-6-polyprenyl-1,4-benzoquinol methylase UbiE [Candidatus Melainabacteria bacterium]|nr:bifunctional demethylmenaquinone methyltransferase/2-methoxy-6-polyprenyl-1,4-benzoquinol methylase UbiE [Candidatus Melainabacteria bacterium]